MDTVYTTTLTDEARRRGIAIDVLDPHLPVFLLRHGRTSVRCYNALTDRVGAATFHLAQDKHAANTFLASHGMAVPAQIMYDSMSEARAFLREHKVVVVKPCAEWGGRGVSVAVTHPRALEAAVRRARAFGTDVVLEQCVTGQDHRIIIVNGRFAAAILREPAFVSGNGRDTVRALIERKNARQCATDPSNRIPLDEETQRTLKAAGLTPGSVPARGRKIEVRRTTNVHTGGTATDISDTVNPRLIRAARQVAELYAVPVLGVDFLVEPGTGRYWIIEVSVDLAISPPEGPRVAACFLDYLFPETARAGQRRNKAKSPRARRSPA